MKNNDNHLRLFVYGTLKKGFWNFDRFCTRAISIEPATTWGRLYQLPAGFPALEVPESGVLVTGTADPLADTRTQNTIELPENAMNRPEGDWDLVHGELMTFANPAFDLPLFGGPADLLQLLVHPPRVPISQSLRQGHYRRLSDRSHGSLDMGHLNDRRAL